MRRSIAYGLVAAVLVGGGWLLVQHLPPPSAPSATPKRYAIAPCGDSTVLLDEGTGQTWLLNRQRDGRSVWAPLARADSAEGLPALQAAAPTAATPSGPDRNIASSLGEALKALGYVSIPLDRFRSGYHAIEVRVAGHDLYLMLDTGAPTTHFDRDRTRDVPLKWQAIDAKPDPSIEAVAGRRAATACANVEAIEIGPFRTGRLVVGENPVADLNRLLKDYADPSIDGVLGSDVLEKHAAVIDYHTKTLYLRKREVKD